MSAGLITYPFTYRYVRLAPDRPSRTGWLFSKMPLTATNWEVCLPLHTLDRHMYLILSKIEIEFKIHGKGNLHGDGMALWLTKQRALAGPVFGSVDKFEGLGVFFDTYKNNRPGVVFPYVMAMIGDGEKSYDKNNDGKDQELAGCSVSPAATCFGANHSRAVRLVGYVVQAFLRKPGLPIFKISL